MNLHTFADLTPQIDPHLISMALGCWSWYLILIDTMLVVIVIGILVSTLNFTLLNLFIILFILMLLLLFSTLLKERECTRYSLLEVHAILDDESRRNEVIGYLDNALYHR